MERSERLPVEDLVPDLRAALAAPGAAAVLTAEPGAGKTTIVPLRLLDEPWAAGAGGRIVVLEPRRVATRAAARRMAALLGEDVGATVGYRTRDDARVSAATRIEVVTEGVLTRRLQRDRTLPGVALVVFDEFHERSLHADVGLALTLDTRRHGRGDLRILVMSATLDVDRVASLVGGTVLRSEGRAHPVDIRWLPRTKKDRLEDVMAAAIRRALRDEERGDVLAFLPGAGEIHRVQRLLDGDGLDVRPLYGALPAHEQDAALAPPPPHATARRVVLATDIAETSLTVEGVRIVVDSGLARVPRYDAASGMTRLRTVTTSKASADQRAGRAGRTEPGAAYRLWSKLEQAARPPHRDAEITQVDLAGLVLELAAWGTADPADLPFLEPPPRRAVEDARRLLTLLGALHTEDGTITDAGRAMAELPLHPRLAHMVAASALSFDGPIACAVAALLEDRDVLREKDPPADLAMRVSLLASEDDRRELRTARTRTADIAQRAGVDLSLPLMVERTGDVLALAYPDRIAENRSRPGSTPGRFRLPGAGDAWLPATDALAHAARIVVAETDGRKANPRIRLAAALSG